MRHPNLVLASIGILAASLAAPARGGGDFNGDGVEDVAIATPNDRVIGVPVGSVTVMYSTQYGISIFFSAQQLLTAFHFGLTPNLDDRFGESLAIGDFDGDGFDDLAIGIPNREVDGNVDAGAVGVVYGSATGLDPDRHQLWTQDSPGIKGSTAGGSYSPDTFGYALAAGDFNGDGRDDLAVGVPGEETGAITDAGAVAVLYGGKKGLSKKQNRLWYLEAAGIDGDPAVSDRLGRALIAGDFDGDGRDDLAAGAPFADTPAGGQVLVLFGSKKGITANDEILLDPAGLAGVVDSPSFFGLKFAAGDFDDNGADDLAICASGMGEPGITSAGAVFVLYGGPAGLDLVDFDLWSQAILAVGPNQPYDQFGDAATAGDFDGNGIDDLAVGVPFGALLGFENAGFVVILSGTVGGLTGTGLELWSQGSAGVDGVEEGGEYFGRALASSDLDGDGADDLLIGAPNESTAGAAGCGVVHVLDGELGGTGLTSTGNLILNPGDTIDGTPQDGDSFGFTIGS